MSVKVDTGVELKNDMMMTFIDGKREKEIGLGVDWPFTGLQEDECVVYSGFSGKVKVGDTITVNQNSWMFWRTVYEYYNQEAEAYGWQKMPVFDRHNYYDTASFQSYITCKVVGFYDQTYGKSDSNGYTRNIYYSFENWFQKFLRETDFTNSKFEPNEDFKRWINTEGSENYFVDMIMMNFPDPRYKVYEDPSYDRIRANVIKYV